jgi:BMFP domain-containing protein YqiC
LQKIQPELDKLAKLADRHSEELRKELEPQLKKVVEETFGKA